MTWLLCWLLPVSLAAGADAGLVNGDFAVDTAGRGLADGWSTSGDAGVKMRTRRERTPDGRWAQVLECTEFKQSGPASHAMLCQVDKVRLEKGAWYRLRMRLRGEDLVAGSINVAIQNMADWSNCGLSDGAMVDETWREAEFWFQATQTAGERTRLQLWWTSTGTVWFQDVRLERTTAPQRRWLEEVAAATGRNLVPNGGFEAGSAGWGSVADVRGWGGNLNRLVGDVVTNGAHGGQGCLRIALTPQTTPTVWFDYYDMLQQPATKLFAANRGWLTVEPRRRYTLSAWLRAEPAGLTAVFRARQSNGRSDKSVQVSGEWVRYESTFTASGDQLYVAVGPDLDASKRDSGTLWVDDVQLVAGESAGADEPRAALTVGLRPGADGGLFTPGEPVFVNATVANRDSGERKVTLVWSVSDGFDQPVGEWARQVSVPGGAAAEQKLTVPDAKPGFYRVTVTAAGADVCPSRPLRLAVITPNHREDTVCGMNHGYPTGDLLDESRRIGLGWFRDWSLKWDHLEPEPGRWRFQGADAQIDRVRQHKLQVLAVLPFPSARWASSRPAASTATTSDGVRESVAAAPQDEAAFVNYIKQTVSHLRGRVEAFEIFNEPIYTGYSLPKRLGYQVSDYVRWLDIAAKAAREANPNVFVIGGIQCPPNALMVEFIRAGGLKSVDAVSIHAYPGRARPETLIAGLEDMRAAMVAAGRANLPIYWTEGAYYADDDPPLRPIIRWYNPLPDEHLCSAFTARLNVILCAHNVRRIIYHSGTPGEINNEDGAGIFFEYDGLPRKMVCELAAFNHFIGPDFVAGEPLTTTAGTYAYRFESGGRTVVVAWSLVKRPPLAVDRALWRAMDMYGAERPPGPVMLSGDPVYLVANGAAPALPAW